MSEVWSIRSLSPMQKLVLLKLADNANDSGSSCFPGLKNIAENCGCAEKSASRAIKELEAAGHITKRRRFAMSNYYTIHPRQNDLEDGKSSRSQSPKGGDTESVNKGQRVLNIGSQSPTNHQGTIIEPSGEPPVKNPLSPAQEQERLLKLRCGKLFRYTERRKWDKGEKAAWKNSKAAVKSTTEEEWAVLDSYYALPDNVNGKEIYKRRSLSVLLNNWNSELSKAIEYFQNNPADAVDTCPAGDIAKSFNDTLGAKLEMISQPTDKRRAMIRAAWKYPVIGQDFENIKRLWAEVKKSKFLMGYGQGSNFKASFDWILSDEDRIVRIMEGQFRDEKR